jgi:hypothetical protein
MTRYVPIIRRALPDVVLVVVEGDEDGDVAPFVVAEVPVDVVVAMVDVAVVVHVGRVERKRIERLPRHKTRTLVPIITDLKSGAAFMATGLGAIWPMSLLIVPTRRQLTLLLLLTHQRNQLTLLQLRIHQRKRTPILNPKMQHMPMVHNPRLADWPFMRRIFNTPVCYITGVANDRHILTVLYGLHSPEGDRGDTVFLVLRMDCLSYTECGIWHTEH